MRRCADVSDGQKEDGKRQTKMERDKDDGEGERRRGWQERQSEG